MPDKIHNTDLRIDQIPSINSDYSTIAVFALTFDGYNRIKDIALFANKILAEFQNDHAIVAKPTLTELRACLFYEQRRFHHFGEDPEGGDREYINILLLEITKRIQDQLID
ncbi:MAG TPA: hypothetical protein PLE74_07815 [Candidatus Cloacimonadota bacterium]|nr:hypothetical protein [Candidatus Cloacimonadota bacterium]